MRSSFWATPTRRLPQSLLRMHIPVYHMEAGNRSFDANGLEHQIAEWLTMCVASFNLPYNDYSMRNLLSEGIHPRRISKTGSPIQEIFAKNKEAIQSSDVLKRLGLEKKAYILAVFTGKRTWIFPFALPQQWLALRLSSLGFNSECSCQPIHETKKKRLMNRV